MRLDNLVASHRAVAGQSPGRKWLTEEINHALIVRLASEFQGFCRDLHDEAIYHLVGSGSISAPMVQSVVRALLENGRKLDSGNANWGNVGHDFGRLGMSVADDLRTAHPTRYAQWVGKLERLNKARNAIAHDDRDKLTECHADQPLTLGTFRRWRSALNQVARGLDQVVAAYLKDLTGAKPW